MRTMAQQFLNLSLFIILLSLFIVLNTLVSFDEEKSRPIIESITTALSTDILTEDINPSTSRKDNRQSRFQGRSLDKLKDLFESQITGIEADKNFAGTSMVIRLPLNRFQRALDSRDPVGFVDAADTENLMALNDFFLPVLISLLRAEQEGEVPYKMDMLINIPENPAFLNNSNPGSLGQTMRDASALAEKLEKAGLPKKLISAGVSQGETGFITLSFNRYQPFDVIKLLQEQDQGQ